VVVGFSPINAAIGPPLTKFRRRKTTTVIANMSGKIKIKRLEM
jgi:hypothetical protein